MSNNHLVYSEGLRVYSSLIIGYAGAWISYHDFEKSDDFFKNHKGSIIAFSIPALFLFYKYFGLIWWLFALIITVGISFVWRTYLRKWTLRLLNTIGLTNYFSGRTVLEDLMSDTSLIFGRVTVQKKDGWSLVSYIKDHDKKKCHPLKAGEGGVSMFVDKSINPKGEEKEHRAHKKEYSSITYIPMSEIKTIELSYEENND